MHLEEFNPFQSRPNVLFASNPPQKTAKVAAARFLPAATGAFNEGAAIPRLARL
jgi:hypothetical protein